MVEESSWLVFKVRVTLKSTDLICNGCFYYIDDLAFNQTSVYILRDLFGGGLAVP